MTVLLLDTSFLVAFLQERDQFHPWAVSAMDSRAGILATCEAVVTETCYLLRDRLIAKRSLLSAVASGRIDTPFILSSEAAAIGALMERYRNIPMSLADACLVRMAEIHTDSVVVTLDGDFKIYRKSNRNVIPTLMPPET